MALNVQPLPSYLGRIGKNAARLPVLVVPRDRLSARAGIRRPAAGKCAATEERRSVRMVPVQVAEQERAAECLLVEHGRRLVQSGAGHPERQQAACRYARVRYRRYTRRSAAARCRSPASSREYRKNKLASFSARLPQDLPQVPPTCSQLRRNATNVRHNWSVPLVRQLISRRPTRSKHHDR
jgi:hypothetical protein